MNIREIKGTLKPGSEFKALVCVLDTYSYSDDKWALRVFDLSGETILLCDKSDELEVIDKDDVIDIYGVVKNSAIKTIDVINVKFFINQEKTRKNFTHTKIADAITLSFGNPVHVKGILSKVESAVNKNNANYLNIAIQDVTGTWKFPVWDNYETYKDGLSVGTVVSIMGTIKTFNDEIQINNPEIEIDTEADPTEYVPHYDIPSELKEYFDATVKSMSEPYNMLVMAATGALKTNDAKWKEFTTAPAAVEQHHSKLGGLFIHTCGVMKACESMIQAYADKPFFYDGSNVINRDRVLLKAIFHDIRKTKEYNFKTVISYNKGALHHIFGSIAYVEVVNEELGNIISEEELTNIQNSILCHHGPYEFDHNHSKYRQPQTAEDYILHLADMIDSQLCKCIESGK